MRGVLALGAAVDRGVTLAAMTGKDHAAWDRLAERFRQLAAGGDVTGVVPGRAPTTAALTAELGGDPDETLHLSERPGAPSDR